MAAVITLPDIKRCSPVSVTGDTPVLNVLKPVAKSSLTDLLRNPVDLFIVADKVILNLCNLDEP